jgi:hypothetical protein
LLVVAWWLAGGWKKVVELCVVRVVVLPLLSHKCITFFDGRGGEYR